MEKFRKRRLKQMKKKGRKENRNWIALRDRDDTIAWLFLYNTLSKPLIADKLFNYSSYLEYWSRIFLRFKSTL